MDAQEWPITYRIAVGPQQGRKVFSLQTLPPREVDPVGSDRAAKAAGFSLHAGVSAEAHQRDKLERLCRYIVLPTMYATLFRMPYDENAQALQGTTGQTSRALRSKQPGSVEPEMAGFHGGKPFSGSSGSPRPGVAAL